MTLTIRNKLILIGSIAVIGLAGVGYFAYTNIAALGQLNGIYSVTTSNSVLVQRMTLHRQELAESFYLAILHRNGNAILQDDIDAMTGYAGKLTAMTSRFVGRDISYIDKETQAKASGLAKDIADIATVRLPEMIAAGTGSAQVDALTAEFKEKAAALGEAQIALRDTVYDEGTKVGDQVINLIAGSEKELLIIVGAGVVLLTVLIALIATSIARPLKRMVADIERLSVGDYSQELGGKGRKDEIGDVVNALGVLQQYTADKAKAEAEAEMQRRQAAESEKKRIMHQMADSFEASVKGVVAEVASSAGQMQAGAESVTHIAANTKERSALVVNVSAEAAQTSSQVAAAAEELTASIKEISAQTQKSSQIASDASAKAEHAKDSINLLSEKSTRVGQIIEVITGIAGQINLLALNATIESARAGEAGKGFAVVASEVKNLATQVGKATDEITQQINEMQGATKTSVDSVLDILAIIGQVSGSTSAVAAAVEEQSAVTNEIARNIVRTSSGTQEISNNMVSVQDGADKTGQTASQVLESARSLNDQSNTLKQKVDEFLRTIRAA